MTYQLYTNGISQNTSQDRCLVAYTKYLDAFRKNKDNDPLAQAHLRKICTALNNYMRIKHTARYRFPVLMVSL